MKTNEKIYHEGHEGIGCKILWIGVNRTDWLWDGLFASYLRGLRVPGGDALSLT